MRLRNEVLATIFILGLVLNLIWENLHSRLYLHYQGQVITELILLKATLFDAIFITTTFFIVFKLTLAKNKLLWVTLASLTGSIVIELFALATNRWSYASSMPLLPLLNIGLTPTIQLALISAGIYYLAKKIKLLELNRSA